MHLFDNETPLFLDPHLCQIVSRYIESTHTELPFVKYIIAHQPQHHSGFILSQIITAPLAETIISLIDKDSIDIIIVKDLIQHLPYDDQNQRKIIKAVYTHTGELIKIDPPKDYNKEYLIEHQRYFDALFDEMTFDKLVSELISLLGEKSEICDQSVHNLFAVHE